MKQLIIFLYLLLPFWAQAQGGTWTWVKGDSVVVNTVSLGNYGTITVPDINNEAPGRYHCTYWIDTADNFWIFGGQIFNIGSLNDLWRYEPATNIWTWMKGAQITTNTAGIMGTQGIPSTNNYPPAMGLTGLGWTDTNNNLWLLHQYGDLWRYSILNNEWTWMKGTGLPNQTPVYGTQGVAAMTNTPGSNSESKSCWTDSNNHLWLYLKGNIWRYDIATNMWTWIKGNGAGPITPNYGTQGIPAITNQPPQGSTFNCWKDQSDRFYIGFGTFGNASVWRYDAATNMWVWLNGDPAPTVNHGRRFLSMCTASTDRHPGIRVEGRGGMHRTDCSEDLLWFCGGQDNGYYNDLWVYKPSNNTWTWIAGDSTGGNYGQYGVKGVPAATNQLADRTGHAMWVDQYQQVWVFGGIVRGGTSRGNDLWRFTPDMNCLGVVVDTFQLYPPADTLLCYGEQSTMFAHAQFSLNVSPMTGVSFNSDSTQIYFQPQQSTTYTVSGSVSALCPYPRQISFTITVQDDPMPVFSDTVLCVGETFAIALDTSYQFQFQPSAQVVYTPGADSAHFPSSALTYTVSATRHGCPVRNQSQFTVQILPDPVAAFTINPAYAPIELPVFQLINQSNGASSFAWFQGNNWLDTTWNYTYTAADTGWYCFRLIAYNSLHCADSITHCAEVLPGSALFIPNAFSPNADGVNDVFNIVAKNITLLSFRIYNRWGQELFSTSDINKGWDGKYKGVDCELGVYFYIAEYSDRAGKGYMKKGDLSLIR